MVVYSDTISGLPVFLRIDRTKYGWFIFWDDFVYDVEENKFSYIIDEEALMPYRGFKTLLGALWYYLRHKKQILSFTNWIK